MTDWLSDMIGLGAFGVLLYNTVETSRAKREAQSAKHSILEVSKDMKLLEENTNSKMDQTLEAVKAQGRSDVIAADLKGEARGRAAGDKE